MVWILNQHNKRSGSVSLDRWLSPHWTGGSAAKEYSVKILVNSEIMEEAYWKEEHVSWLKKSTFRELYPEKEAVQEKVSIINDKKEKGKDKKRSNWKIAIGVALLLVSWPLLPLIIPVVMIGILGSLFFGWDIMEIVSRIKHGIVEVVFVLLWSVFGLVAIKNLVLLDNSYFIMETWILWSVIGAMGIRYSFWKRYDRKKSVLVISWVIYILVGGVLIFS